MADHRSDGLTASEVMDAVCDLLIEGERGDYAWICEWPDGHAEPRRVIVVVPERGSA